MTKKADQFRAMAEDKRRQAKAAWNPHVMRQLLEIANSYERRAQAEDQKSATRYADDADYDFVPQWPRRAEPRPARASILAGPGIGAD